MKVFLMHKDLSFDAVARLPANEKALVQDLELGVILGAMAGDDGFLMDVAKRALLSSLVDLDQILYRQSVLKDCLKNSKVVRDIYRVATETDLGERGIWGWYNPYNSVDQLLGRSVKVLRFFVDKLGELRGIVDNHAREFESEGFKALFAVFNEELSDDYLESVRELLRGLESMDGTLISAELGRGNKGARYALCRQQDRRQPRVGRVFGRREAHQYTLSLDVNDQTGTEMLSELRDRGINEVANTLAQSANHVLGFFNSMRTELAFYVALLNLHEKLSSKGEPTCLPVPLERGRRAQSSAGLYDPCLALKLERSVVANDLRAADKDLVMVTGANRGGKSTFLRSIGVALLLMQCGAFVPAESFSSDVCTGLFTHFRREEDRTMVSGKLDEELGRISDIVDHLSSDCVVLFNESFSATNEREGSEVARQIVSALVERQVRVYFVTHQYDFAGGLYEKKLPNTLFLRAERGASGERTFKIVPGEPLETSYGEDLFGQIFLGTTKGAAPTSRTPPKGVPDSGKA